MYIDRLVLASATPLSISTFLVDQSVSTFYVIYSIACFLTRAVCLILFYNYHLPCLPPTTLIIFYNTHLPPYHHGGSGICLV